MKRRSTPRTLYRDASRRSSTRALYATALALAVLSVSSCGYSTRSLVSGDAKTVAVAMVENPTFRRDLEFQLTSDLKEAILSRTDLRIVDERRADIVLVGKIVRVREQVLAENRVDDVLESSVIITVEFTARNRASGKDDTVRMTDRAEFLTGRGEDLNSATEESFDDLAERIVYELLEEPF